MPSSPSASTRSAEEVQRPRISHVPPYVSSIGQEAVELAALAGLHLDPWQAYILGESLGERQDGRWASFEVGVCAPRQNGKDAILEARELTGMFLLPEKTLIHSAHEFSTSLEHFQRIENLIEGCSSLSRRVKTIKRSHGEEGFVLFDGTRLRFKARTKGGARGWTADLVVFNEAMIVSTAAHGAILPTLAARSVIGNPQVWYTGSPVDRQLHEHGMVFARVRARGLAGDDSLAYFECSVDAEDPDSVSEATATDPAAWQQANLGLGVRISAEHIALEQRSLDARTFAVERLGVGDWPDPDGDDDQVIAAERWKACADSRATPRNPVCLAFDVSPDRRWGSISVAGCDDAGDVIELVERRRGTGWIVDRIVELAKRHDPADVACDGRGPAASLVRDLRLEDLEVTVLNGQEYAQACGAFHDACGTEGPDGETVEATVRHLDQPELNASVKGAAVRPLGDAWAWSRKSSSVDITPLVSATVALARHRAQALGESSWERRAARGEKELL